MCVSSPVWGPPHTKPEPRRSLWQPRPSPGLDKLGGRGGLAGEQLGSCNLSGLVCPDVSVPPQVPKASPALSLYPNIMAVVLKSQEPGPNLPKRRQASQEKPKASSFPPRSELPLLARPCQVRGRPVSEGHPIPLWADSPWMASESLSSSCHALVPPPRPGPTWGEEEGEQGMAAAVSGPRGAAGGQGCGAAHHGHARATTPASRLPVAFQCLALPHGGVTHLSPPWSPRPSSPPTAPPWSPCCPCRTARPPAAPSPCHGEALGRTVRRRG